MKTLSLVLLLGSLLAGCQKEAGPVTSTLSLGQPFSLASQQYATLPADGGGPVQVKLTELLDSRCPSGMQCIWEGYVAVTVTLTDATNTTQTARVGLSRIAIPPYTRDSVAVTLNQQPYWLRLLAVSDSRSGSAQTATLRLRRQ